MHVNEKINDLNLQFYNNLDIAPFKLLAQVGGFNTYKDLDIVFPYIRHASVIIEIGAGYGRCIDFLLHKNYSGKIIAVEQSAHLVQYLQERYSDLADIREEKIQDLLLPEKAQAALWMWSGLIDFSHEEQVECIQKICTMLTPGGRLVIDLPKSGFKTIGQHQDTKNIVFESEYGTLQCYIPDQEDLSNYAKAAHMKIIFRKDYATATDKLRTIFVLENPSIQ